MASFWGLFLLAAYGILGGFVHVLNNWLAHFHVDVKPWTKIPILGDFGIGAAISLAVQLLVGFLIYRFLNRPKVADMLIETETELRKVVWPSWADTWAGTMAVVVTVVVLLAYLAVADRFYIWFFSSVLG
jgi:preprotein translocase subunit SecE